MQIRDTYKRGELEFLTKPMLQKFSADHKLPTTQNRADLIKNIENFANSSMDNENVVQNWMDMVLKMGIKTCVVTKFFPGDITNIKILERRMQEKFPECKQEYICKSIPNNELKLIKYEFIERENQIVYAKFNFVINLVRAQSTYSEIGDIIEFPVFVDMDFENGFIISRCKSMKGLFRVISGNKIDSSSVYKIENIMRDCEKQLISAINFEYESTEVSKNKFKKVIFKMLDAFTKTPKVIQDSMNRVADDRKNFVDNIFKRLNLKVEGDNYKDALYDIEIFVEKYLSIYCPDREIFMMDREAYPTKFLAQDNEFTTIQEKTGGIDDPLQNKKAFFDSKKVVYSNKKCDRLNLCYQRKEKKYFGNNPFNVMIYLDRNSCMLKFTKAVEEGDIQNVLSRIIQNYDV